jgi:hypothetical protein
MKANKPEWLEKLIAGVVIAVFCLVVYFLYRFIPVSLFLFTTDVSIQEIIAVAVLALYVAIGVAVAYAVNFLLDKLPSPKPP